jgi:hypothetical protein
MDSGGYAHSHPLGFPPLCQTQTKLMHPEEYANKTKCSIKDTHDQELAYMC